MWGRRALANALAALALVPAAVGCIAGERMLAGRKDYAMYRDFRLADTTLLRLRYGNRYLKEVPGGRFRPEVDRWFKDSESAYYRNARDRPSLLRAYLAALPDGPHAEQVIDRLIELDMLREYRKKQASREEEKVHRAASELERAALGREKLVKELTAWISGVSSIQTFGGPTEALPHELLFELQLREPKMHCDGGRCSKAVHVDYAVPGKLRLVPREATFTVELSLDHDRLRSATLTGPELFSRLAEALSLAPVEPNDFAARIDAIARSVAFVENVLEPRLPKASCGRDFVAPVVLVRECAGVRVELRAGEGADASDGLTIRGSAPEVTPKGRRR